MSGGDAPLASPFFRFGTPRGGSKVHRTARGRSRRIFGFVTTPLTVTTVTAMAAALAVSACSRGNATPSETSPRVLVGSGATLPYPLYSKWATEYASVDPTVRVNYQSVGSGAGVRQVSDGVVDFGATEEPAESTKTSGAKLVAVPTTIGAVVFAYNLPAGSASPLALTPELAADILLGRLTRWDDPRLRAANGSRPLPDGAITVVHRADGSGTSAALTSWLSAKSDAWRGTVGSGTSPRFPVGVGAKGNEGIAAFVKSTPLSIGYVELAYARHAGLPMAVVQNRAGKLVAPSVDGIERAARSIPIPASGEPSAPLFEATDEGAYPIAAVSFVVLRDEGNDRPRAEALAKFLWWAIHDGQRLAANLDYAPLTPSLVARGEQALHALRVDGAPLLPAGG